LDYAGTATGDTELINKEIRSDVPGDDHGSRQRRLDDHHFSSAAKRNRSDLPVVTMCFRIQRWSLKKDWSVQIEAADRHGFHVRPDVVAEANGQRRASALPACSIPIPLGPVWAPYQVQASRATRCFPSEWTFDSDQEYTTLADGKRAREGLIVTANFR